ncbi:MAG: hypothetical protein AAF250_06700 [Pseudomonadota bacterium]
MHIYNADQSFLSNVLGWRIEGWLRRTIDPPSPEVPRIIFWSCDCANAYLPAALYGGMLFSFLAHLVAAGVWICVASGASRRMFYQLTSAWVIFTLAGIAKNYHTIASDAGLLYPGERGDYYVYLSQYLWSMPMQFAFNATVFLVVPILIILGFKRIFSGDKSFDGNAT